MSTPTTLAGKGSLATITGSVKDDKGNPLAGALVSLLKDGANVVIKETKTNNDGRFMAVLAVTAFAQLPKDLMQSRLHRLRCVPHKVDLPIQSGADWLRQDFTRAAQRSRGRPLDPSFSTNTPFDLPGSGG